MFSPGQKIQLRVSARSDTGRVRDNNEDRVHFVAKDQMVLAIVADGMGGAVAGEEASRIAVDTISEVLIHPGTDFPNGYREMDEEALATRMREAIGDANDNIVLEAQKHPEFKGMGTTVTMAFIRHTHVVLGHVGDSRAYLIDGSSGEILQITADHSFVQALVTAGHITAEEAEDHPMRNVLYRALGQAHDVEIDIYYEKLRVGDRMVLCSDGLTLHLKPDEIAQIVLAADTPNEASKKLIDLANNRGGRDNVSAVVVKVERDKSGDTQDLSKVATEPESDSNEGDFDYLNEDTLIIDRSSYHSSESPAMPSDKDRDSKSKLSVATPAKPMDDHRREPLADSGRMPGNRSNETSSDSAGEGHDPLKNHL